MTPAGLVRAFFERMQARDWDAAGMLLSDAVHIEYTETGEQFDGPAFLAMNSAYPEGWTLEVVEMVGEGDRVAAQVRVLHDGETFWCAGFYTVEGGVITEGIEHWVTERSSSPPAWRSDFSS